MVYNFDESDSIVLTEGKICGKRRIPKEVEMLSEAEFAELGDSLSTGFFIDNVIMALVRTQRLDQLQGEDRTVIECALHLLRHVLKGEKWLDVRRFTKESPESAIAFDRAVTAWSIPLRAPQDFTEYIRNLEQVTSTLLQQGKAEVEEVEQLRHFFSNYGRRVFVEAQDVIERSGRPQGLLL